MSLFVGIYDSPGGHLIADYSPIARDLVFSTNEHGFADLSFRVPLRLSETFWLYDRPGLPHVVVAAGGAIAWEGRLEDASITDGGLYLKALGYQRALSDIPYTALWSTTSYADWRAMTADDRPNTRTEKFEVDNNNRLYIALKKNETYTTATHIGRLGFVAPAGGVRYLKTVSFDYKIYLNTGYTFALVSTSGGLGGSQTAEFSVLGSGALFGGSANVTLTNSAADSLRVEINPATDTYTGETGDRYIKITNLRIKTTTSAAVYADEIARALVEYTHAANSAQIASETVLIESPALDMTDEIYLDRYPSDILNTLIALGDNAAPPRRWEWGVYENRLLHLRPRGSAGRVWFVDAVSLEVERTIDSVRNSVYAVYQDRNNVPQRTPLAADEDSVTQYGATRRAAISAKTTSATQAGVIRDTALSDLKNPTPRATLRFNMLYDAAGARWPGWLCRSGDTITIRNLPPTLNDDARVRTFTVAETRYEADTRTLQVTPESPLPRLDVLLARLGEKI
jgi:hypothetical protein